METPSPPRWRTLGTLCRERDWSRRRLIYELQNGLAYRTIPPGHVIDWHHPRVKRGLNVEASEVEIFLSAEVAAAEKEGACFVVWFDKPTVSLEVLPPTDDDMSVIDPSNIDTILASPPARRWGKRNPVPEEAFKVAAVAVAERYQPDDPPTFDDWWTALKERLGPMTREIARDALRRFAPHLLRKTGQKRNRQT